MRKRHLDAVHEISMHIQSTTAEIGARTMAQHQKIHTTEQFNELEWGCTLGLTRQLLFWQHSPQDSIRHCIAAGIVPQCRGIPQICSLCSTKTIKSVLAYGHAYKATWPQPVLLLQDSRYATSVS